MEDGWIQFDLNYFFIYYVPIYSLTNEFIYSLFINLFITGREENGRWDRLYFYLYQGDKIREDGTDSILIYFRRRRDGKMGRIP